MEGVEDLLENLKLSAAERRSIQINPELEEKVGETPA
jgi:hypothetical protein